MSLGRLQGLPLIGQPLQLSLPFTLSPGEEQPCLRADLLQGDGPPSLLEPRIDTVDEERRVLRLTSRQAVVEPAITVRVLVGCAQPFSRAFVLLAEPPAVVRESQPAPPAADPAPASTVTVPAVVAPPTPRPTAAAAGASEPAPVRKPAASRRTAQAPVRSRAAAPAPRTEASARPTMNLRLSVDLLDVAPVPAATPAPARPAPDAPPAAVAVPPPAAASAPAIAAPAAAPTAAYAEEVRQLRELTQRQSEQLAQIGHERDVLRDILAACIGALAVAIGVVLWVRVRQSRRQPAWWQDGQRPPHDAAAGGRPATALAAAAAPPEDVDSDWSGMERSMPATMNVGLPVLPDDDPHEDMPEPSPAARAEAPAPAFADSVLGRGRLPSAEELLDVQERANFFIAIGQEDQAIALLETRLHEHYGASPFLWLDLLDLCRRLDRPDDYERVRAQFHASFPARLPGFEAAPDHSDGLERYPRALSRITLLWPTRKVLREIEASLFAAPLDGAIQFDLEASRDLLLLYSIATEVLDEVPPSMPGVGERSPYDDGLATQPVPLIDLDLGQEEEAPQALGLDVDFGALDGADDRSTPLPSIAPDAPAGSMALDLDLDAVAAPRAR